MEVFANFQKYDEKKRRMNIFAIENLGVLNILYFPCSKQDEFSKRRGWELYRNFFMVENFGHEVLFDGQSLPKPTILRINVVDNKPKKTFINWCNDNFYHITEKVVRYNRWVLEGKNGKKIHVKDSPLNNCKLSSY